MVGTPRWGAPVRQDGRRVVKALYCPSPDAALGDADSAARCPYYPLLAKRGKGRGEELGFIENNEPLTLALSPLGRGEGNCLELYNPIKTLVFRRFYLKSAFASRLNWSKRAKKASQFVPPTRQFVPPTRQFVLPTSQFVLPTSQFVLPTSQFVLPTSQFVPPTRQFVLPTRQFVPPTRQFVLPTSQFVLPTSQFVLPTSQFVLPTSQFVLPTSQFVLPTRQFVLRQVSLFLRHVSLFFDKSVCSSDKWDYADDKLRS